MDNVEFPLELLERLLVELPMETFVSIYNKEVIGKILTSRSFWKHKVEARLGYSIEMDFDKPGYMVWENIYNNVNWNLDLNESFINAFLNGHTEIVALLLNDERIYPTNQNNASIRYASRYGYIEIVALLLNDKRVDPSANNNEAIRMASQNGHTEVVELLLQDPRVSSTYRK